jgi:hypothetical protein
MRDQIEFNIGAVMAMFWTPNATWTYEIIKPNKVDAKMYLLRVLFDDRPPLEVNIDKSSSAGDILGIITRELGK